MIKAESGSECMTNSHFEKEKFNFPKDEFNFWPCSSLLPMNPLPFIYFHNKKILFFKGLHCNFPQIDRVLTFFWLHFWAVEIVSSLSQYQPMNWLLWQLHLRLPFEVLLLSEIEQSNDQDQLLDKYRYQTSTRPVHYLISPKLIKKHFFFSLSCADFILFGSF